MKVELIDYTGRGHSDPLYAARLLVYAKATRLEQGLETRNAINSMVPEEIEKELRAIALTIRSSWEFVDYTFEIKDVTRAFTHQFVRTRTGSYAQQAQRVVNMSGFKARMPPTIEAADGGENWLGLMEAIRKTYIFYQSQGVPSQDCRGALPTNVLTNIIAKFNLRTLADLTGKRDNPRAQDEYAEVAARMAAAVLEVHQWALDFLYPERMRTPALDVIMERLLGSGSPVDNPELNSALKEIDALKAVWG